MTIGVLCLGLMAVTTPRSSGLRGHLSGGQDRRYPPVAAAGGNRRAGPVADGGVGDGGGDRVGRQPEHDQAAEVAWIPIRYPHAIYDHDEQRWVSDAEVAEVAFTAFTGRRHAEHITARGDRAPGSPAQPDPHTTGQSKLFAPYRYHAVCTDNPQPMLDAQATHRHHAIVEQVIADLKESALAYLPSGHANANAAWLVCAAIAHNLTRAAGSLASSFHARARTRHHPHPADQHPRPRPGSGLTHPPNRARPEITAEKPDRTGRSPTPDNPNPIRKINFQRAATARWIQAQTSLNYNKPGISKV